MMMSRRLTAVVAVIALLMFGACQKNVIEDG